MTSGIGTNLVKAIKNEDLGTIEELVKNSSKESLGLLLSVTKVLCPQTPKMKEITKIFEKWINRRSLEFCIDKNNLKGVKNLISKPLPDLSDLLGRTCSFDGMNKAQISSMKQINALVLSKMKKLPPNAIHYLGSPEAVSNFVKLAGELNDPAIFRYSIINPDVAVAMIENGVDLEMTGNEGNNLLLDACHRGIHASVVEAILKKASKDYLIKYGPQALTLACKSDNIEMIKALANAGIPVTQSHIDQLEWPLKEEKLVDNPIWGGIQPRSYEFKENLREGIAYLKKKLLMRSNL